MHTHLLFQLYGPMQAWGEIAVGEIRPSALHPTRSGVFGILAAALGIRRNESDRLEALRDGYDFALRIDGPGSAMLDYHTIQTPRNRKKRVFYTRRDETGPLLEPGEDLNTILSRREYLTDAVFTVCLQSHKDSAPYSLSILAEALKKPRFTPYLGRKSCPAGIPFRPMVITGANRDEAFASYPADANLAAIGFDSSPTYVADTSPEKHHAAQFTRRDFPAHFTRRQFNTRTEYRFKQASLTQQEESGESA